MATLPNLRQMLLHKFFDSERLLALLSSVHPPIVMRRRFEMADGAGNVSGALWLELARMICAALWALMLG
jgi:hypothetical protein